MSDVEVEERAKTTGIRSGTSRRIEQSYDKFNIDSRWLSFDVGNMLQAHNEHLQAVQQLQRQLLR